MRILSRSITRVKSWNDWEGGGNRETSCLFYSSFSSCSIKESSLNICDFSSWYIWNSFVSSFRLSEKEIRVVLVSIEDRNCWMSWKKRESHWLTIWLKIPSILLLFISRCSNNFDYLLKFPSFWAFRW